jgi:uncharacterized lipoprotein YajG
MKMKKILALLILTLSMAGCVKPLAYFTTEPYAKPFENKVNKTLYIVLSDDVKDSFIVKYGERNILTVSQFRKSFASSLRNTFNKNFSKVEFQIKKVDTGLCLVVYRVKTFWGIGSTSSHYNYNTHRNETVDHVAANFQFESSLYYNGAKINADDAESSSDASTASSNNLHFIFSDGVRVMCEHINAILFTDPILQKIR